MMYHYYQRGVMRNGKEFGFSIVGVKVKKTNVFTTQFDPQITESDVKNNLHRQLGLDITGAAVDTT